MCKAPRSWRRDKYIFRSKTVTMTTKCKSVHNRVYSTVLNGSIKWPWSGAMINKVRAWESQILRLRFRPRRILDETWVGIKIRTSRFMRLCWRKEQSPQPRFEAALLCATEETLKQVYLDAEMLLLSRSPGTTLDLHCQSVLDWICLSTCVRRRPGILEMSSVARVRQPGKLGRRWCPHRSERGTCA